MCVPWRKKLPHQTPWWVRGGIEGEVYFMTICTRPKGVNQLAHDEVWPVIEASVLYQQDMGRWDCALFLAMPDHVHLLAGFDDSGGMSKCISHWKRWIARKLGVAWQRDYFDHRLRSHESAEEKAHYIRMNPVRAGLVARPDDWKYQWNR